MSKRSNTTTTATIIILAISGLLIIGAALIGSEETTGPDLTETFEFVAADHGLGEAVAVAKRVHEGSTIFWIEFREDEHEVTVTFTAGEECSAALTDLETWPSDDVDCTGPAGLSGRLAGEGRTADGLALVSVAVPVTEECYAAVEPGMQWASAPAVCR